MSKKKFNFRIYYEDTDAEGVVYYANYLKFLERARTQILIDRDFNHSIIKEKYNILFIVKSCYINYVNPAKLDDYLYVTTNLISKSKVKINLDQCIYCKKKLMISSNIQLVSINLKGEPTRMSSELFDIF